MMKLVRLLLLVIVTAWLPVLHPSPAAAEPVLAKYLDQMQAAELVPGAEAFGPIRADAAVAPVLKGGGTIGCAGRNRRGDLDPRDRRGPRGGSGRRDLDGRV